MNFIQKCLFATRVLRTFPDMTKLMELPEVFHQKCRMQGNIKKVRKPVLGVGNTGSRRGNTLAEYIAANNIV